MKKISIVSTILICLFVTLIPLNVTAQIQNSENESRPEEIYSDTNNNDIGVAPDVTNASVGIKHSNNIARVTPKAAATYKVEHYLEEFDGSFTLYETNVFQSTADAIVNANLINSSKHLPDDANTNNVLTGTVQADGSLTLKVYYKFLGYKITFLHYDRTEITSVYLKNGAAINAPDDPERIGYNFMGWEPAIDATVDGQDKTYQAIFHGKDGIPFKIEEYIEQLDGSYAVGRTFNREGTAGATVNISNGLYTGFRYDPYNQNEVRSGVIAGDGSLVLKVYYTRNTYGAYYLDYDNTILHREFLKHGAALLAQEDPTREGYTFAGWTPSVAATLPMNDVVYRATYTVNQYAMTFVDHDGSVILAETKDFGSDLTAPTVAERPGYTFTGWTPAVDAKVPAMDKTFTATYALRNDIPYNVEHYQQQLDGSYVLFETEAYQGTTDVTVNAGTKTYTGFSQDVTNPNNILEGEVAADGSLVLKVYYNRNTYTITFKDYDGTIIQVINGVYGDRYSVPTVPDRESYEFSHWAESTRASLRTNLRSLQETIPAYNVVFIATYRFKGVQPEPSVEPTIAPGYDDGGPFTTDECGTIRDRWGNVMYQPATCQLQSGYKVPNTGVK